MSTTIYAIVAILIINLIACRVAFKVIFVGEDTSHPKSLTWPRIFSFSVIVFIANLVSFYVAVSVFGLF